MNEYSAEVKAQTLLILKFNKNNFTKTAKDCGLNVKTVREWAAAYESGKLPRLEKLASNLKEKQLTEILEEKLRMGLERGGELLPNATMSETTAFIGTIAEKLRLLNDESTQIVDVNVRSREEKEDRVKQILDRVKERIKDSKKAALKKEKEAKSEAE